MCGRYTLRTPLTVLAQRFLFDLGDLPSDLTLKPRYNVAPTQTVAAVRQRADGRRELALFQWGLVPSWAKDIKLSASMINARAETLAEKPAFRTALSRHRCLVLADGYFEWKKVGKEKRPLYFRMRDERPFAFAGLWECWRGPESGSGPQLESCTIVTTSANELSASIHDRMPVILEEEDYEAWLNLETTEPARLQPLLHSFPSDEMKAEPVSMRVNNVRNDDLDCLALAPELF
jgi:putative SOS response-associated peptidase YedK